MMMPSLFTENLFDDFFNDFDEDFFGKKNPLYGKHARNMMKTEKQIRHMKQMLTYQASRKKISMSTMKMDI